MVAHMRISRAAVAALVLGVVGPVGVVAPAHAASRVLTDPAGDAGGVKRLDITRAKVRNRDHAVVARVTFAKAVAGDLIVSIDPRGAKGLRLVAERKRDGTITSRVLPGAFTDRGGAAGSEPCTDLRVQWIQDVARLVMPSTCLHDGDYGAIRFAVLTENRATDSDYTPETDTGNIGVSGWIARG